MTTQRPTDETIRASGSSTYDAVDAERFEATGSTRVTGDLRAEAVDLSGSTRVDGDLIAAAVEAAGSVTVEGDVRADTLECAGSSEFGAVEAGRFETAGSTSLDSVLATDVVVRGAVTADTVDARDVEFELADESTVGRIVAESVAVAPHEAAGALASLEEFVGDLLGGGNRGRLVADRIEGETISLDAARVGTVVGDAVRLGPAVAVDTVRARDLEAHPDATVGAVERVESVERTDTGVETVERVE